MDEKKIESTSENEKGAVLTGIPLKIFLTLCVIGIIGMIMKLWFHFS